tara:strand:- start:21 stop:530 length:510 start_codon:yes stop_codon:yes gene_type:complete
MDRNGYVGRAPADSSVVVSRQIFTASAAQTNFTFSSGYTPGYIDLYLNGVRLLEGTDYVATDGTTITLLSGATLNDVLEGVAYKAFNLTNNRVGVQSGGAFIGNAETLNFVGTGNTFLVNGSTIDVSISSGAASIMVVPTRAGTAVTFNIPSSNTLDVIGRSSTINVPV